VTGTFYCPWLFECVLLRTVGTSVGAGVRHCLLLQSVPSRKHINTLCGQKVELLNVKLAVYIVTAGLRGVTRDGSRCP
jgi:hypothetical protein